MKWASYLTDMKNNLSSKFQDYGVSPVKYQIKK